MVCLYYRCPVLLIVGDNSPAVDAVVRKVIPLKSIGCNNFPIIGGYYSIPHTADKLEGKK